jgi:methyl-accepting chemotaxis protein
MNKKNETYLRKIYRQEANRGEKTAYFFRWVLIPVLAVLALLMLRNESERAAGRYGLMIDGIGLIYNTALIFMIKRVDRFPYVKYVSVSIDIALVTSFYLLVSIFQSPVAVATSVVMYLYPTLIFLAALRQDKTLIVYATLFTVALNNIAYFARYGAIPKELVENVYMVGVSGQIFRTVYILIFGFFVLQMPDIIMRLLTKQQTFFEQAREGLDKLSAEMTASTANLDALGVELEGAARAVSLDIETINERLGETRRMTELQESSFRESVELHGEMSRISDTLLGLISKQNDEVERCSSAVREMSENSSSVFESTRTADRESTDLLSISNEGKALLAGMGGLVAEVAAKSESLVNVIGVIESIAEQTDLLALNAAIEAAHAGQSGKGFSVVAGEIKKLAKQSGEQTRRIGSELEGIRASVAEVVGSSREAEAAFASIFTRIGTMGGSVRDINASMDRQLGYSKSISSSIEELNRETEVVEGSGTLLSDRARRMDAGLKAMREANGTIDADARTIFESAAGIYGMMTRLLELSRENRRTITAMVEQMESLKRVVSG